jgi:xanthine dehydrogenase accessory factor
MVTRCGSGCVTRELRGADAWREEWESPHVVALEKETTIIERFMPKLRLIILGGGHIAAPLATIGSLLNFDVTVFDDRPSFADRARFPTAREVICDSFDRVMPRVAICKRDAVVIVTRGHRHDQDCLRGILNREISDFPDYVGMIGSRRRAAIVRRQMEEEGFNPELVARLHSPIGLAINAVSPEEIALSIMAEIVKERRSAYRGDFPDISLIERLAGLESEIEAGKADKADKADKNAAIVTILSTPAA